MSIAELKLYQLLVTLVVFVLPALIVALILGRRTVGHRYMLRDACRWWHLNHQPNWTLTLAWVGLILLASPGVNLLSDVNQHLHLPWPEWEQYFRDYEDQAAEITLLFLEPHAWYDLLVNLLLMAILPAMAEELFFRGTLLRYNTHIAVWMVAAVFSAVHMQLYGFIPRMLLGAMLGYAYIWSGNLWVPMLMHAANNALAVIAYHVTFRMGVDPESVNAIGGYGTRWVGVLSLLLTLAGFYGLYRYYKRQIGK